MVIEQDVPGTGDPVAADPTSEAGRLAQRSAEAFGDADRSPDPQVKADRLAAAQELAGDSELAAAYTYLQRVVGIIAVLLPAVLALGNMLFNGVELRGSISGYYYTPVGSVFVGALCALAVFFLSYNYRPLPRYELDNVLSNLACLAALGVAFFPTTDHAATASSGEKAVALVHLLCACALFVLLAVFSLVLFTRTGGGGRSAAKGRRNVVYRVCGGLIVATIALVVVSNIVDPPSSWHSLFWLESVGVVAFGISWLVKGWRPRLGAPA